MNAIKRVWSGWKSLSHYIGDFQSRLLLSIFYFTLLLPFGLGARWFDDSLQLKFDRPLQSGWVKRPSAPHGLDDARRHF
jgi:hypothetical protein